MTKKTTKEAEPLPLDLPEPRIKPTGHPMNTSKPCTLPLSRSIVTTRVVGSHTEVDRKLWVVLVALAWDNLATQRVHDVNLRDVARLFRSLNGGENGTKWLIESAQRLRQSGFNWKDEKETGTCALLSSLTIRHEDGQIFYEFPNELIRKILENDYFSRIILHFMIGMSGKYSIPLYSMLESVANLHNPVIEVPIETLRDILSVPEGKLAPWKHLYEFAIKPAIIEINAHSEKAGFSVNMEPIMQGRRVKAVFFMVTKVISREKDDFRARTRKATATAKSAGQIPPFTGLDYDKIRAAVKTRFDIHTLEYEWRSVFFGKEPPKNPVGAFIAWLRKRKP